MTATFAITALGPLPAAIADTGISRAVYTSTNAVPGNEVVIFERAGDGTLTPKGRVSTQGTGTGGGLGNQGAIALSRNGRWLFAVNAGSNEISAFALRANRLTLVDKVSSGGQLPVSLTIHGDELFVLNAGGVNNITGFWIGEWGTLAPIPHSTRLLGAPATGPAQVQFDPTVSASRSTGAGILSFPRRSGRREQERAFVLPTPG